MTYEVRLRPAAERDLQRLPADVQRRVLQRLSGLSDTPRPRSAQPLHGDLKGVWRVRVGDYRISYVVDDGAHLVRVARIGHRSTFYRRL